MVGGFTERLLRSRGQIPIQEQSQTSLPNGTWVTVSRRIVNQNSPVFL
jgi:hypothetical protein